MKAKIKVAALLAASAFCGLGSAAIVWLLASDIASGRFSGGVELAEAAACGAVMAVLGGVSCAGYAAIALRVKL